MHYIYIVSFKTCVLIDYSGRSLHPNSTTRKVESAHEFEGTTCARSKIGASQSENTTKEQCSHFTAKKHINQAASKVVRFSLLLVLGTITLQTRTSYLTGVVYKHVENQRVVVSAVKYEWEKNVKNNTYLNTNESLRQGACKQ